MRAFPRGIFGPRQEIASGSDEVGVGAPATDQNEGELQSALAAFYDRSVREVYRYFHRATAGDRRLTEDLTQETFMACVRAAQQGQPDATTMPWLMGVARHKLIDHHRRRSREDHKLSLAWNAEPVLQSMTDVDVTDAQALEALKGLSPLHRLVLVLRYVDDLSVGDVALAVGRSVSATESLLARARRALDEQLGGAARV